MTVRRLLMTSAVVALMSATGAQAQVQPYATNDAGGFRDVLPPGANGHTSAVDAGLFLSTGRRPGHNDDQLRMYTDLLYASPGLRDEDIGRYFRDATFGVRDGDVERKYSPCPDVTIVRDRGFGVPHVYGSTREATMCGVGYATAEDRLFLMDVLRHAGRARLSAFAGGAPGNRAQDAATWTVSPYSEAELERQVTDLKGSGPDGEQAYRDIVAYVNGINRYIAQARRDPLKLPAEYAAIGRPAGPADFRLSDTAAIGELIGTQFGTGGGHELAWTQLRQAFQARLGSRPGAATFLDFRAPADPEAPTTVHRRRFPYRPIPRRAARGSVAIPDPGSVRPTTVATAAGDAALRGLLALPAAASNALLVSARRSASNRPIAVFGPQVGYFAPQLLMQLDVHGPGIDAAGATAPGAVPYVVIGHGRDYAWSLTAGYAQDLEDTYALALCDPAGGTPTMRSTHYRFDGQCLPIERLAQVNSWTPNVIDRTPPGSQALTAQRTRLGLVIARATIRGRPVVYTRLRQTYLNGHRSAARTFMALNDPARVRGPRDFQRAAARMHYGFNFFYTDARHIAYFNSGGNPLRPAGTNPLFPVWGERQFRWKRFDPQTGRADYTPFAQHPQAIDQHYIVNWNEKHARGYDTPDTRFTYSSIYRSQPLDDRLRATLARGRKLTLAGLIDIMQDAATVDLRGAKVLPWALRVVGTPDDRKLAAAVEKLRTWHARGAHRIDRDRDGAYDDAEAIRIMDAWWPLLVKAQFEPVLGKELLQQLAAADPIDSPPNTNGAHLGSAFLTGFYGHVHKDLRAILGRRVRGRLSRTYCGRGVLTRCRADLTGALAKATDQPLDQVYPGDQQCPAGNQICWDQIFFRMASAISQRPIPWVNRPTYQQAVEVKRPHR